MNREGLTVWQQLESGHEFSFESALLAVIKQCEYELSQSYAESSGAIQNYKIALENARVKYADAKNQFERVLISEWYDMGGDYAIIAKALDTGWYDGLVF